jgi:hypothetical protein
MNKIESKLLQDKALWLVMHPCQSMGWEQEKLYPWRAAEAIRLAQKIEYYLRPMKHKAKVVPDHLNCISHLSQYKNMQTQEDLVDYMKKYSLNNIVYCGFDYGICIISEKHLGMAEVSKQTDYNLYLKHTLCCGPVDSNWFLGDETTEQFSTII